MRWVFCILFPSSFPAPLQFSATQHQIMGGFENKFIKLMIISIFVSIIIALSFLGGGGGGGGNAVKTNSSGGFQ